MQLDQNDIHYREGTEKDLYDTFCILRYAFMDLSYRNNWSDSPAVSEEDIQRRWLNMRSMYTHLYHSAEHFWVAESDNTIVGYARSVMRGTMRELTDLFVHPEIQEKGIGRELIKRAFPAEGADHRSIIATSDLRAQARYLKAGVYPRIPIYILFKEPPEIVNYKTELEFEALSDRPETLEILGRIDEVVLGHRRDVDHQWLLSDRKGFLYRHRGNILGYGYIGESSGPFALLDERYYADVLSHAESEAAHQERESFTLGMPMVNAHAVQHVLEQGFKLGTFFCYLMSDVSFGQFDKYICTSPMLIL